MGDLERNVRVSFKLSREAAIKLREIALTRSELLCNLGVLAVQLGNESQICISSSLGFDRTDPNDARTTNTLDQRPNIRNAEKTNQLRDGKKIPEVENCVKTLLNVDRGVRAVDQVVARATVASVRVSDSLPSMKTVNKAPLMKKTSSQESNARTHNNHAKSCKESEDITSGLHASSSTSDQAVAIKPISRNGVLKFNGKQVFQDADPHKNALYVKQPGKSSRDDGKDSPCSGNEIQDDLSITDLITAGVSSNIMKGKVKHTTSSQESNGIRKACSKSQDLPKGSNAIDPAGQNDRKEIKMDSTTAVIENDMTDDNVNNDLNNIPTFPGHGISFAQHLINLSKQYRLENEKSPTGLSNEKFFPSDTSRIVRNDHVLRSFTTANEKQEDFMGFSGQNALLFDCNYSATAVKSAEELSKEQSEASPTNLDSMSETSADSLFEEARLGSVDELSLSPSSNENVPVSSEDNSRTTSPAPAENMQSDNHHLQIKQEKQKRKRKYQRHLKGHGGIVCKLCMHPVQKSYSCYNLTQAPKEIRHLFDDGSDCVRVCRRCLPYKSPKSSEKNSQKKLHKTIQQLLK